MTAELLALVLALATPPDAPASEAPQRRGFHDPRRVPNESGPAPSDALIRNSGSTNFAGYVVLVHPDGSADVAVGDGPSEHKAVGAAQTRWLFAKLRAASPLGSLPAARCMKSASFGSSTTISYDGQQTPDLSCAGDAATRELMRTVGVIVDQLGIDLRRSQRNPRRMI